MNSWEVPDRDINPPEPDVLGYDWKGQEIYFYQEGFLIDGEFVPVEDAQDYLKDRYGLEDAETLFD